MKIFLIFLTVIVHVIGEEYPSIEAGEINDESFSDISPYFANNSRAASGSNARRGENLDFCYISVRFQQRWQTCGCVLVDAQWVATSARCVIDNSEGRASNITVTFPQLSKRSATKKINKFVVPTGDNGKNADDTTTLDAYDPALDVPFNIAGPSNVAMIKLADPLKIDTKRIKKTTVTTFTDFPTFLSGTTNSKYRTCGIGFINNQGKKPKGVVCTDVNPISWEDCTTTTDNTVVNMPEDGTAICLQWPDRDQNVCTGDYGGPVWSYTTDSKGRQLTSQLFCITVTSPDVRTGATCLDAHKVICMFLPGNVNAWITNIIAGR